MLPDSLAHDVEGLARFEREAHLLASLNHPHIAHIHGFEDSTGTSALVMELVEGRTLADRIAQGPIPVDEALPIAKQIAEALEAAHEQGIIHRDLKPANIKVRADGTVKVLDFGLAKALALDPASVTSTDAANSPTITSPAMTLHGVILGTAAYMAPEQARGRTVDRRADIWAFGCVLYEMLTGRRAFDGDDISTTLAAVLRADPEWSALPPATPPVCDGFYGSVCTKIPGGGCKPSATPACRSKTSWLVRRKTSARRQPFSSRRGGAARLGIKRLDAIATEDVQDLKADSSSDRRRRSTTC